MWKMKKMKILEKILNSIIKKNQKFKKIRKMKIFKKNSKNQN